MFRFYTPLKYEKPMVFSHFQGVHTLNTGLKMG